MTPPEDAHPEVGERDDRLPDRATMGLLAYLSTHTVDEDYAFVSARRQRADGDAVGHAPPSRRRAGPVAALVMALFAVLVVTAGAQTSRNASSDETQRRELVAQVAQARRQLATDRASATRLRTETATLLSTQLSEDAAVRRLQVTTQLLGTDAGTLPVRGPGVRVVADDAPNADSARNEVLDADLQRLANGFWAAGAEAISLNGQRLTNLSTIRLAGGAITVNNHSLRHPYVLLVIGNKDTLPARFAETSSGQAWLDLERQVGLRLSITPATSLRLPAAEVSLRYANQNSGGTP